MNIEGAIKLLKQEPDFSLSYYKREKAIDILLEAYEKQQKEIVELKMQLEVEKIDNKYNQEETYEETIPKYKIKSKIEECENKIKKIRSKKLINEPEDTIIITRYAHYISVLQSLLEKE